MNDAAEAGGIQGVGCGRFGIRNGVGVGFVCASPAADQVAIAAAPEAKHRTSANQVRNERVRRMGGHTFASREGSLAGRSNLAQYPAGA